MPKCFASVIARKSTTSVLAAVASKLIGSPAARQIGPFVSEDACPPLMLCLTHKEFMTAATHLRLMDAATFRDCQESSPSADKN